MGQAARPSRVRNFSRSMSPVCSFSVRAQCFEALGQGDDPRHLGRDQPDYEISESSMRSFNAERKFEMVVRGVLISCGVENASDHKPLAGLVQCRIQRESGRLGCLVRDSGELGSNHCASIATGRVDRGPMCVGDASTD
jgi:hypothetical protein